MSSQDAYNVVFGALIIGLLIFNSNLRDEIETVKGFSQLDVDKSFERLDEIELRIDEHETQLGYQSEHLVTTSEGGILVLDEIERLDENITILDANTGILQENQQQLRKAVGNIERYLADLTGN